LLELKNISVRLTQTDRLLVEDFSFVLNAGDKAVIIGEEGNGKSTLLKLVYDTEMVEDYCEYSGRVVKKGTLGYLPQMFPVEFLDLTVGQAVGDSDRLKIFSQLGLDYNALEGQVMRTLSGGEKIKVQLAKLLMAGPDILLLDEPTNDIDIETLTWLEGFIKGSRQPVLFISHDETLIERCANVIIHVEQLVRKTKPKVTVARTGYAEYVKARGLAFDKQMQVARKQRSDFASQMRRVSRVRDKVDHANKTIAKAERDTVGRKLKVKMQAVKATERRLKKESEDFLDIPQMEEAILTKFDADIVMHSGKVVLDLSLPVLRAGGCGKVLARDVTLKVMGGEKVGIIGRNGAGKTTLLREIWEALRGRKDIRAVYMPQDYREVLDLDLSAVEFLAPNGKKDSVQHVRTFLGSMKFTHDEMTGPIAALSGGQRAKVLFLDMVLKRADVLVLDEPTRNFSPLSSPVIRETIGAFGGTVISVSHDRKYLEEVCGRVVEVGI